MAAANDRPVQDAAWLKAELDAANTLLGQAGIGVEVGQVPLDAIHARLENRDDRDALATERTTGHIDVFIVASLRDVDDPTQYRRGVHWRNRKHRAQRYVIVSAVAGPSVLAHELGHYLGNGHSQVVDNVMSYKREDPTKLFFDEGQKKTMRRAAAELVRRGFKVSGDTRTPTDRR